MRARPGFTLIELLVVLVLLSITAVAAVPAFTAARRDPDRAAADSIVALLTRARDGARERGARTELVIAPRDARFWLDAGTSVETGRLALDATQHLVGSDSERVTCSFSAVGTASPCGIAVRGAADIIVRVNPWTGTINTSVSVR